MLLIVCPLAFIPIALHRADSMMRSNPSYCFSHSPVAIQHEHRYYSDYGYNAILHVSPCKSTQLC